MKILSLEEIEQIEKVFNKVILPGSLELAIKNLIETAKHLHMAKNPTE